MLLGISLLIPEEAKENFECYLLGILVGPKQFDFTALFFLNQQLDIYLKYD